MMKIVEMLGTPSDNLSNSKVLLSKRLNECLNNHGITKELYTVKKNWTLFYIKEHFGFENYLPILTCQNNNILIETGILGSTVQEIFEKEITKILCPN